MEIELIAVTRVALGIGLGLLLAGRLKNSERRPIGWALMALGGLTTLPLRSDVLSRSSHSTRFDRSSLASIRKEHSK
jgi:hypothetical protein